MGWTDMNYTRDANKPPGIRSGQIRSERLCWNCQSSDHQKRECPYPRTEKQERKVQLSYRQYREKASVPPRLMRNRYGRGNSISPHVTYKCDRLPKRDWSERGDVHPPASGSAAAQHRSAASDMKMTTGVSRLPTSSVCEAQGPSASNITQAGTGQSGPLDTHDHRQIIQAVIQVISSDLAARGHTSVSKLETLMTSFLSCVWEHYIGHLSQNELAGIIQHRTQAFLQSMYMWGQASPLNQVSDVTADMAASADLSDITVNLNNLLLTNGDTADTGM